MAAEAIASNSAGSYSAKAFKESFNSNTSFDYNIAEGTVQVVEDALINNRDKGRQFLYMGFGRQTTAWTPDDNDPPTPLNTQADFDAFYDDMVGLKQVDNTKIQVVTERVNFIIGESYVVGDVVLVDDTANSKYQVFRFNTIAGGGGSIVVTANPKDVTLDSNNIATTVDGTWEFLYEMTLDEKFEFTTGSDGDKDANGWMLVKENWSRSKGRAVMIYVRLGDEANAALSAGFRQIGLLRNVMKDQDGGTGNYVKLSTNPQTFYVPADFVTRDTGTQKYVNDIVIYQENRTLITKSADSFEDIRIVLRF